MLPASAISIVVLATALTKEKPGQPKYSYYFDRAVPMKQTWGSIFDVELAFGTNVFDWEFLAQRCAAVRERRRLRVTSPQTKPRDVLEAYDCRDNLRVLYMANCTGEYMGLGPVCRCQEAVRYWLRHMGDDDKQDRFSDTQWFIFMDDDVYFRPHALRALLDGFDASQPMAFVGAHGSRGLSLTRARWEKCGAICAMRFPWAQPAILSRAAVEKLRPFVDRNFMTEAQKAWFGTHDVHLGLALWWLSIPTISIGGRSIVAGSSRGVDGKATRLNTQTGIMQHVVRGGDGHSASHDAAHLFELLNDATERDQIAVGARARKGLLMSWNDGASAFLRGKGVSPAEGALYLDPALCLLDDPGALLDATADRAGESRCRFHVLDLDRNATRLLLRPRVTSGGAGEADADASSSFSVQSDADVRVDSQQQQLPSVGLLGALAGDANETGTRHHHRLHGRAAGRDNATLSQLQQHHGRGHHHPRHRHHPGGGALPDGVRPDSRAHLPHPHHRRGSGNPRLLASAV